MARVKKKTSVTRSSRKVSALDYSARQLTVQLSLALVGGALIVRLAYIGVLQNHKYSSLADGQHHAVVSVEAHRGRILDRYGKVLSTNEACYSIGVDLRRVVDRRAVAGSLAKALNEPPSNLLSRMQSSSPFLWLQRQVDADKAERVRRLELAGVVIEKDARRRYPHAEIGAHLIGFTDVDNVGIAGIEKFYDNKLRGHQGRKIIQRDAVGNRIPTLAAPQVPAVHGQDVYLTIDYLIQTIATDELRKAIAAYDADQGIVVVTDPMTGEILAMACEPGFDPNHPGSYSAGTRRNRAIVDLYEPGSTFKLITFAAIFEKGLQTADDVIFCENGSFKIADQIITDHGERYGNLTVREVLAKSSNIGTVKLAKRVGEETLYYFARDFGFGMETGVTFDGEAAGLLKPPVKWSGVTYAAMAMGYEVLVTPLQMAMAYGAVANGGLLLKPRLVAAIGGSEPEPLQPHAEVVRRVISEQTAAQLQQLLELAVKEGTGKNAACEDVRVAGKTGTAQRADAKGRGYSKTNFNASFIGYFPAEQPQFLINVLLENPRTTYWGGLVAAPTFKRIATRILESQPVSAITNRLNHSPEISNQEMNMDAHTIVIPDLTSRHRAVGEGILKELGLEPVWDGNGEFIVNQMPAPGATVFGNSKVTLQLFEMGQESDELRMPKLTGLSVRQALQQLAMVGVEAHVVGSGRVTKQYPPANTPITPGIRCEIRCQAEQLVSATEAL